MLRWVVVAVTVAMTALVVELFVYVLLHGNAVLGRVMTGVFVGELGVVVVGVVALSAMLVWEEFRRG